MKILISSLLLIAFNANASKLSVYAEKIEAKAVCLTKLSCGYWQGEYECERSGTKLFLATEIKEKIDILGSEYSYKTSKSCNDIKSTGVFKTGKAPKDLKKLLKENGESVEVVIYPNGKYFQNNL